MTGFFARLWGGTKRDQAVADQILAQATDADGVRIGSAADYDPERPGDTFNSYGMEKVGDQYWVYSRKPNGRKVKVAERSDAKSAERIYALCKSTFGGDHG